MGFDTTPGNTIIRKGNADSFENESGGPRLLGEAEK